jgi:hypothetical protein
MDSGFKSSTTAARCGCIRTTVLNTPTVCGAWSRPSISCPIGDPRWRAAPVRPTGRAAHFYRLVAQMRTSHPDESQLMFMVFDLLHQDGVD